MSEAKTKRRRVFGDVFERNLCKLAKWPADFSVYSMEHLAGDRVLIKAAIPIGTYDNGNPVWPKAISRVTRKVTLDLADFRAIERD